MAALTSGYQPLPGVYDEMMGMDGTVRPAWAKIMAPMGAMGEAERKRAFAAGDRHLRDAGVFYRVYDETGGGERPWPLNHMPLVLSPQDFAHLKAGIIQRAEMLERVLADAYGHGHLIRDGLLPAAVFAGHRDYLRPLTGAQPRGGRFLRLYAADIGRGPDGNWWVLSDRTQAPSGMGYALENRLAASRAFPDLYRQMNVDRLAGFFAAFRAELSSLNAGADARVGLLTPGPFNETYFEHAYLARYLGFLLVEGEDLVVRDEAVHVRTVSGLKRVDVLWRRLDADYADPLELAVHSRLGVPGLVQAIRAGQVVMANALGSGVLENRALMGFMPRLARALMGEDLLLPNIATWWCGQEAERKHVADNIDKMVISPAFTDSLPGLGPGYQTLGASLTDAQKEGLRAHLDRRGVDVVGQEVVKLSTMPAWQDGALVPRPFVLRLFAIATEDGWQVMPGGFCRISDNDDARAVSLQQGARTADVWVVSEGEVAMSSLIPPAESIEVRRSTGALPSRAADNLFWLARNLERAEGLLRIVRALIGRIVDDDRVHHASMDRLIALLDEMGALPTKDRSEDPGTLAILALTGAAHGSVATLARSARFSGAAIRDRLAPDAWAAITAFAEKFGHAEGQITDLTDALDLSREGLQIVSAFAGLSAENMIRRIGWRFLDIGRRIERGVMTSRYLRALARPDTDTASLDLLLELCDCQIAYRSLYVATARVPLLDLLALDANNPRSLAAQTRRLSEHLATLPDDTTDGRPSKTLRIAERLKAYLATEMAEELEQSLFSAVIDDLHQISNTLSTRFFVHRRGAGRVQEEVG